MSEQSSFALSATAPSLPLVPALAWSQAQFQLAARLAGLFDSPSLPLLQAVLTAGKCPHELVDQQGSALQDLQQQLAQLQLAEREIRSAFVIHPPTSFRITVSHGDLHRMPGSVHLELGEEVRLVAHTTERWITAQVAYVPETPREYFEGVIVEIAAGGGRFRVGDRVQFSEDQIELPKTLKPITRRRPSRRGASRNARAA